MASRVSLSRPGLSGSVAMDYLAPRLVRRAQIGGTQTTWEYDFAAQNYTVSQEHNIKTPAHPLERNEMFMNIARDFLALVEGHTLIGIEHFPRLDRIGESARLIADAWEQRRFDGETTKEIP